MARNTAARGAIAVSVLAGVIALAGCVPAAPTPVPTETAVQPGPTPTGTAAPVFVEGGTAEENQPYFDKINLEFFAQNGKGDGQRIIDNLVAAGFSKQDMEVTPDRTTLDLEADSIIFSVRLKGECLIGDLRVSFYKSVVAPLLGTGGCLVGATRPIDW